MLMVVGIDGDGDDDDDSYCARRIAGFADCTMGKANSGRCDGWPSPSKPPELHSLASIRAAIQVSVASLYQAFHSKAL